MHILLGSILASAITLACLFFSLLKRHYIFSFFAERGLLQPITLSIAITVISYSIARMASVARERKRCKTTSMPSRSDVVRQRKTVDNRHILSEIIGITGTSRDVLSNRICRILQILKETSSRELAREIHIEDVQLTIAKIENSLMIPKLLIWAMPMLGFLGTVLGISQAVAGFSGVLDNSSDPSALRSSLSTVTSGMGIAFDTTILGIVSAVSCMYAITILEEKETTLAQEIETEINDKILPRIGDDGTFY